MTAPREPLSRIEEEMYQFLLDFLAEHTFQPSVREIGRALKIPSTKSVADLLTSLETKGYVRKHPGRSRGVSLVGFEGSMGTMPVPLLGLNPATGVLEVDDHVTLDRRTSTPPMRSWCARYRTARRHTAFCKTTWCWCILRPARMTAISLWPAWAARSSCAR